MTAPFVYWLQRNGYKVQRRRITSFIQRGRRGYADSDLWSFDRYLCMVIGQGASRLAAITHGYPSELSGEKWNDILERIAAGMRAGLEIIDLDYVRDTGEIDKDYLTALQVEFDESMDLLKTYFFGMWD